MKFIAHAPKIMKLYPKNEVVTVGELTFDVKNEIPTNAEYRTRTGEATFTREWVNVDFEDSDLDGVTGVDEKIQESFTLKVFFWPYVAGQPTFEVTLDHPPTLRDLLVHTRDWWKQIYAEEDAKSEIPVGRCGNLLNRNTTNGPYGIWGHDIEDLTLDSFDLLNNGAWSPSVSS